MRRVGIEDVALPGSLARIVNTARESMAWCKGEVGTVDPVFMKLRGHCGVDVRAGGMASMEETQRFVALGL
jgi:hypothetical protein